MRRWIVPTAGLVLVTWAAHARDDAPPRVAIPEVLRIRVPESRLREFLPADAAVRVMPAAEVDVLEREAREAREALARAAPARLIRAEHRARWEAGVLHGSSDLITLAEGSLPTALRLDPWSPAIVSASDGAGLRARPDGSLVAWIATPGRDRLSLRWRLDPGADDDDPRFDLALPDCRPSGLTLDLPAGVVPEATRGVRDGPFPADDPAERRWRWDDASGRLTIRLRPTARLAEDRPAAIVRGATRLDVRAEGATWTADWVVDLPEGPDPQALVLHCDPSLLVRGVAGPDISGFDVAPRPAGSELRVDFVGGPGRPASLRIEALARVPAAGAWSVPSVSPINGVWLGGRTVVRLGPSRTLVRCRERGGRRVRPTRPEVEAAPAGATVVAFEAVTSEPAAVLELATPAPEAWAEVRGQLLIGASGPRIEATITWHVRRGRMQELPIRLPSDWVPEALRFVDSDEPADWARASGAAGEPLLVVRAPPAADPASPFVVALTAGRSDGARAVGALAVPRVRPVGVRLASESWGARAEPAYRVRPSAARGLRWLDPTAQERPGDAPAASDAAAALALAWEWTEEDTALVLDVSPRAEPPRVEAWTVARITGDRGTLDWFLVVRGGNPPRPWSIRWSEPPATPVAWSLWADGRDQPVAGGPDASTIELPPALSAPFMLHATGDLPAGGARDIPLLSTHAGEPAEARVLVLSRPSLALRAEAEGLVLADARAAERALARAVLGFDPRAAEAADVRPAAGYAYRSPDARLRLVADRLEPAGAAALIQEAVLTTTRTIEGRRLERLGLAIDAAAPEVLRIELPDGAALLGATLDGQALRPTRQGGALAVALDPGARRLNISYAAGSHDPAAPILRPAWPRLSLPCALTLWEMNAGPGLRVAEPDRDWDVLPGSFPRDADRGASINSSELSRWLHTHVPDTPTLGELLLRMDAGATPLIVDADALRAAGLGPDTRPTADVEDRTFGGLLQALGVTVQAWPGALLATTASDVESPRPAERSRRAAALRQAVALGGDATDRYRAVTRWRSTALLEPVGPAAPGPGAAYRVSHPGLPTAPAALKWTDARRDAALRWLAGIAVLGLGLFAPWPSRRVRAGLLGAGLIALGVLATADVDAARGTLAGGLTGALVLTSVWIGAGMRRARSRRGASSVPVGPAATLAILLGGAVVTGLAGATDGQAADAPAQSASPVVFLFPHADDADPGPMPGRAFVRLADLERLIDGTRAARAEAERRERDRRDGFGATAAIHRLDRRPDGSLHLASRFELAGAPADGAEWPVPAAGLADVRATLDGADTAIRFTNGNGLASVRVAGQGPHVLEVAGEVLDPESRLRDLALTPVALAAFAGTEALAADLGLPGLATSAPDSAGVLTYAIGPVDRLARGVDAREAGTDARLESLALWDAGPAGDHVELRLVLIEGSWPERLEFALDPAWRVVGRSDAARVAPTGATDSDGLPLYALRMAPAQDAGSTRTLDLWRPRSDGPLGGASERGVPTIRWHAPRRVRGMTALRVAAGWTTEGAEGRGRAEPDRSLEAAFRERWGALPLGPDVLRAAWDDDQAPYASWRIDAPGDRWRIQPAYHLLLGPGRVDVRGQFGCVAEGRPLAEIEATIPPDLRIVEVGAAGLTGWSRPEPGRLLLRFDQLEASSRSVRIDAWIDTRPETTESGQERHALRTPVFGWPGADVEAGLLSLSAPPEVQLDPAAETSLTPLTPAESEGLGPVRAAYRIAGAAEPPTLRWNVVRPADVRLFSHLTFRPEEVAWKAVLRYRVRGGPCRTARFEVPAAWADAAEVFLPGASGTVRRERQGTRTRFEVRFDPLEWGEARIVLSATAPLRARGMDFPGLVPLGLGQVETYLAWSDETGRDLVAEGSAGVQPVDASRVDLAESLGPTARLYRVLRGEWRLTIRAPADASRPDSAAPAVSHQEATASLASDGMVGGQTIADVSPGSAAFLAFAMPATIEPIGALIDGDAVRMYRSPDGVLLVPLPDTRRCRVVLHWRTRLARTAVGSPGRMELPIPTGSPGSMLVTVAAPEGVQVGAEGGLRPSTPFAHALDRVEAQAAWIRAEAERLDRSDTGARSALLSDLVAYELLRREALRAASWAGGEREGSDAASATARIRAVDDRLAGSLRLLGLESEHDAARAQLAAGPVAPVRGRPLTVPWPLGASPRRVGVPRWFSGPVSVQAPPALLVSIPGTRPWAAAALPTAFALAVASLLVAVSWSDGRRRVLLGLAGLTAALALLAGGAPSWLA
jgi:hypothetical protein